MDSSRNSVVDNELDQEIMKDPRKKANSVMNAAGDNSRSLNLKIVTPEEQLDSKIIEIDYIDQLKLEIEHCYSEIMSLQDGSHKLVGESKWLTWHLIDEHRQKIKRCQDSIVQMQQFMRDMSQLKERCKSDAEHMTAMLCIENGLDYKTGEPRNKNNMKKFINDNLVFILPGSFAVIGGLFILLYNMSENEWEYTVGSIFWTIAIVSIPVSILVYKAVLKLKKK